MRYLPPSQVWLPPPGYEPLKLVWKPLGLLTGLFYLAVTIYYFYVRLAFTLAMGTTSWYGSSCRRFCAVGHDRLHLQDEQLLCVQGTGSSFLLVGEALL
jgi:hypothetical protein